MTNAIHSGNSSYELGKASKWAFHGHYCNQTATMSGVWLGADLRTDTKRHLWFKRDWTTCSKLVDHPRLNSQHKWGGTSILPFHELKNYHFDNE